MMSSHEFVNIFYQRKKVKNSNLSLRSIARLMGISPSYFSEILGGKKNIPTNKLKEILETLDIDEFAALYLKNCLKNEGHKDFIMTDEDFLNLYREFNADEFHVFKEWYYIPLMELTTLSNFVHDNEWMAKKLNISEAEVGVALFHLKKAGYLNLQDGTLKKTNKQLIYQVKGSEKIALAQNYHRNMISRSLKEFEKNGPEDFKRRTVVGYTLAVNPNVIEDVMKKLKEDLLMSTSIATQGDCQEVYQLNLQFYPLSNSSNETNIH